MEEKEKNITGITDFTEIEINLNDVHCSEVAEQLRGRLLYCSNGEKFEQVKIYCRVGVKGSAGEKERVEKQPLINGIPQTVINIGSLINEVHFHTEDVNNPEKGNAFMKLLAESLQRVVNDVNV